MVNLSQDAQDVLARAINGQGGHQSFFSRLRPSGDRLVLHYDDFSYARERAAVVQGGWLARYTVILNATAPLLEAAGTTKTLFNLKRDARI